MLNNSISEGFDREVEFYYIEFVVNKDINERKPNKKDPNKFRVLLKSLARNTSSIVGDSNIVKDIENYENQSDLLASRQTVSDYLSSLNNLYLIFNQEAFN